MWGHHRAILTARLHSPLLEEQLMFTVLKCPVPKVNAGFSRDQTPSLSSFPRLLKLKTQESTKGAPVKRQVEDFVFLFGLICYLYLWNNFSVQFSLQSCPTLCDPMDCSTPGLPVHHQLPELAQTHVDQVNDAIQPPHPLSSPSPPTFNLSQHQGLFHWVSSLHQVAKGLELQLQQQSFQWIFRIDFL